MPKKTTEDTKASGQPKRILRSRGTQQQPPPPGEPEKKRQRTEASYRAKQNPEEDNEERKMNAKLTKDLNMTSATPSKRRRHEKVSPPQLTSSM